MPGKPAGASVRAHQIVSEVVTTGASVFLTTTTRRPLSRVARRTPEAPAGSAADDGAPRRTEKARRERERGPPPPPPARPSQLRLSALRGSGVDRRSCALPRAHPWLGSRPTRRDQHARPRPLDNRQLSGRPPDLGVPLEPHEDARERGQPDCRCHARREPRAPRHSAPVSAGRASTGGAGPGALLASRGLSMGTAEPDPARSSAGARPDPTAVRRARGRCFGGGSSLDAIGLESESLLVVRRDAGLRQVFLDGRPLGTAGELLARALPLAPGSHVVAIVAPAYRPWVARVAADPPYSTRIRVALVPE